MAHEHWTDYWREGPTSSFGEQTPEWYETRLIPFWRHLFEQLPSDLTVLDVATGNGAVTRVASEVSQRLGKGFRLLAVDRAVTDAPDGVELLPNTRLEQLELAIPVDLVTSQFGLEYSNPEQSLPRLSAALKTDGQIAMVAHHRDSVLSDNSRLELQEYRAILKEEPLFERLEKLVRAIGSPRTAADRKRLQGSRSAQSARLAVNRSISKLTGRFPHGLVVAHLLKQLNPLFQQGMSRPVEEKLEYLQRLLRSQKLARQRLNDQIASAFDEKKQEQFIRLASQNDLQLLETSYLTARDESLLGLILRFRKR